MSRWPKDNQDALLAFYGTPKTRFLEQQLVDVVPPFKMYYEGKGKPIKSIKFHGKAAPALKAALDEIWAHVGHDQAELDRLGVSSYDGAYNPRFIRGSTWKWSNHAYGAAIDLNASKNGFNTGHGNMPQFVVDAFKRQGFRWGGDYKSRTDPMHFEAVDAGVQVVPPAEVAKPKLPEFLDKSNPDLHTSILATEFGDESEIQEGAYGGMVDPDRPGVALPFHFDGKRRNVRITCKGRSVVAAIIDVGPHNINDPYWDTAGRRPLAEKQLAENLKGYKGHRVTNAAGIDFTPAVFDKLGVPGKRGSRSALVDWEFTSAPVAGEKPKAAPPPPEESAEEPVEVAPKDVEVEVIQRRLIALGYHEVGFVDSKLDSRLFGAIAGFKKDRGVEPPTGVIDDALKDELAEAEAEKWKRPVSVERSTATEKEVEQRAPEIVPVKQSRWAALWASVSAGVAAILNAMSDYFQDALSYLVQAKDYLNLVPGWLWLIGIAGVFAFFYFKTRQGAAGIVSSVNTGERN